MNQENLSEKLLESVVRITKQRDQDSLEVSLAMTLSELVSIERVTLVRVEYHYNKLQLDELVVVTRDQDGGEPVCHEGHQIHKHHHALYKECVEAKSAVDSKTEGDVRTVKPVLLNEDVAALVDLSGSGFQPGDEKLISGFIRIYENYLALLNESERDTLTGLLNRKTFDERLGRILSSRALAGQDEDLTEERRTDQAPTRSKSWLAVMDIDRFKSINDTHGHLYGDEVLLLIAQIMQRSFRREDLLFRYGGEEFVIILRNIDHEQAHIVLERFRQSVADFPFPQVGRVTVSMGSIEIRAGDFPASVVGKADKALYYAKDNGRNRVCGYEALFEAGELVETAREEDIELF